MSQIKCPLCGHLCFDKINFASHIRRCKEAGGSKFKYNPKRNKKKYPRGK